ncbi:unnamed protein product [Rotaria magnacalcarata]|uniref:Uncharacterized protein n=1 Tax=Rotaria magnacalcarata TaxID=392030 RepID=A0A819QG70_9BILA|nr:unnamed protein product [Rotaria magnacalcarata]CAF4034670.1 unnamed protein product [Rotaria magnacalcarata]
MIHNSFSFVKELLTLPKSVPPENQRSDIKHSPSTSTIGSTQLTDKLTTDDECQLLMKSSGDFIEQQNVNTSEQRDLAAGNLIGEALLWYRINRLQIPDMQTFIHKFLLMYRSAPTLTFTINSIPKDIDHVHVTPESKSVGTYIEEVKEDSTKSWRTQHGSENSVHWLKNVEQTSEALGLDDQQMLELTTIKLNGLAQERKISEHDKLEYLRRDLRSKLQHYALSVSPLQKFLTIMQPHGQISKEKVINYQTSSSFRSLSSPSSTSPKYQGTVNSSSYINYGSDQQQPNSFVRQQPNYNYQSNHHSTNYESPDHHSRRNSNGWTSTQQQQTNSYRICYQCNKPSHTQQYCPDINSSPNYQQIFQEWSH